MKILVENGCYDLLNIGDVAMLQVAVARLSNLWPSNTIEVITEDRHLLAKYVQNAHPVAAQGRHIWFQDRKLIGRFAKVLPGISVSLLLKLWSQIRRRYPRLSYNLIELNARRRPIDMGLLDTFLESLLQADMLVVSGGGDINDEFMTYAMTLLDVLEMSTRKGIITVMFGQGIGPIDNPRLKARAKAVLPCVDFIAVRENLTSTFILESLGVREEQLIVTGDDAVELAYNDRSAKMGENIGVNLRVTAYSKVNNDHIEIVRKALLTTALEYNIKLIGIPISLQKDSPDVDIISRLSKGCPYGPDTGQDLNNSQDVITRVSSCRIVVTGSYHSAVFALAQGIPVIALANSKYYKNKFLGLSGQFGCGCEVLFLDDEYLSPKLTKSIDNAWQSAEQLRPLLLASAQRQIAQGHLAYQRVYELVEQKKKQMEYVKQN